MSERNKKIDRRTFIGLAAAGAVSATILNGSAGPVLGSFESESISREEIGHDSKPNPEVTSTPNVEKQNIEKRILIERVNPVITEYDVEVSNLPYDELQKIAESHSDFAWEAFNYLAENQNIPEEIVNSESECIKVVVKKNGRSMVGVGILSNQPDQWLVLTHNLGKRIIDHSNTSKGYFDRIDLGVKVLSAPEGGELNFAPGRRVVATDSLRVEVSEWVLGY
jgi:hypothetical protein